MENRHKIKVMQNKSIFSPPELETQYTCKKCKSPIKIIDYENKNKSLKILYVVIFLIVLFANIVFYNFIFDGTEGVFIGKDSDFLILFIKLSAAITTIFGTSSLARYLSVKIILLISKFSHEEK